MSTVKPKPNLVKNSIDDLAIFGGQPAFKEVLHVGRPNLGNRASFSERVNDILDRRWLTNGGRYVQEFEAEIAKLVGVDHCVAVCNATVALEIAIRALGMKGEVIVPSFTFVATAHALQWQEITPVFCDVDPRDNQIILCHHPAPFLARSGLEAHATVRVEEDTGSVPRSPTGSCGLRARSGSDPATGGWSEPPVRTFWQILLTQEHEVSR